MRFQSREHPEADVSGFVFSSLKNLLTAKELLETISFE